MNSGEAKWVGHEPCPACGSRDNLGRYSDGHGFCFGCGRYESAPGSAGRPAELSKDMVFGEVRALPRRGISEATCQHFGYKVGVYKRVPVQIANYFSADRELVAQKLRFADKTFTITGNAKEMLLYGQWLWRDKGKMVVVTEGEIDALSVSQVQKNKWPVVSVPNGAQAAAKAVKKALEWLEGFESVVFMFDNDPEGRKASNECAELLTPGKAKIARLPLKDANAMLTANRADEIVNAIWGAKVYRPDGIIAGHDLTFEDMTVGGAVGIELPYPRLNAMLRGLRKRELTLVTAGTGIGKSTLARELGYYLNQRGQAVGNVFLEESVQKTAMGYVAIDRDIPLGDLRVDPSLLSKEQWEESMLRTVSNGRVYFYNHFGSLESGNLLSKLKYLATGLSVDFIILDHISIVVSGIESSIEGERKDIDILMTRLRQLIEMTGVGVIAICHLKKSSGRPHEEGGSVHLDDLRGSGSLKQLPDNILAMERDMIGEDEDSDRDVCRIKVLKCREFGDTGYADDVRYNRKTGRLLPGEDECPF